MKRILTIAGSDSGGGAGIQADLKAITALGAYGMSVLTALTAQNTLGVQAIHEVPASFVDRQIESVLCDIGADAIKTGMLSNTEIVKTVAKSIKRHRMKRVVVDPVMISKSGAPLLREEAQEALRNLLLPLSMVVTPNLMEASALTGLEVSSISEMKKAARRIHELGVRWVVVKGGHLKGRAIDLLYDGAKYEMIDGPRIETKNTHGTGCTFASALATLLAQGNPVPEAVRKAKDFIALAIRSSLDLGEGTGPANPFAHVLREMDRYRIVQELEEAFEHFKEKEMGDLIPEVSSNLGYALRDAQGVEDVAAFPGRIVRFKDSIVTFGHPEFGGSKHIAGIILTTMRFDPEYRSAMNIRFSKESISLLKKKGFLVGRFDRRHEPKYLRGREGFSLEWGVGEVLKKTGRAPDFIFDEGGPGKEPMIRVIGKNPREVVRKALQACRNQ